MHFVQYSFKDMRNLYLALFMLLLDEALTIFCRSERGSTPEHSVEFLMLTRFKLDRLTSR